MSLVAEGGGGGSDLVYSMGLKTGNQKTPHHFISSL